VKATTHALALLVAVANLLACSDNDVNFIPVDGGIGVDSATADVSLKTDVSALDTAVAVADAATTDICVPGTAGSSTLGDLQDAGTPAPPVPFGIDERPATTSCRPLPRPTGLPGDPFPQTLLATGCFTPTDLREPVAGVIPYSVNAPLWSDGAMKRRFISIPDSQKIRILPDGDFEFPRGSVLLKTFELDGHMLETRFFVRHDDGEWAGYTYVWNKDGKNEATLLGEDAATRNVGFTTWLFPSRNACLSCHTAAAGRSLGLEVAQLNGDYVYPGNRRANQMDTLDHLGLFELTPGPAATLARYASPGLASTGTIEERARAYLHSNCSHCHRPGGLQTEGNLPDIDVRFGLPLAQTNLINRMPLRGAFGVPGVMLVKPGSAAQSMLLVRMKTTVANVRMPGIGSTVVDDLGVTVIGSWIASMKSCP